MFGSLGFSGMRTNLFEPQGFQRSVKERTCPRNPFVSFFPLARPMGSLPLKSDIATQERVRLKFWSELSSTHNSVELLSDISETSVSDCAKSSSFENPKALCFKSP